MLAPPGPAEAHDRRKVRAATHADLDRLVALGAAEWAIVGDDVEYRPDDARAYLERLIDGPDTLIIVTDNLTAMLGAMIAPHIVNGTVIQAQALHWFAEKPGAGREVLDAFIGWAEQTGATKILVSATLTRRHAQLDKYLKRLGFEADEQTYELRKT